MPHRSTLDLPGPLVAVHPMPKTEAHSLAAPATSRGELANLQLLRALAASLVLIHHAAAYAQSLRGADRPFVTLDKAMGVWGVAIFFALSGFLMARIVVRDAPLVFLAHRVGRIFPTYFLVVGLSATIFAALGLNFGGISLLGMSLAPAGPRSYPLNVEWTLVFEISFYVGLFLLASAGLAQRIAFVAVGWIAILLAAALLFPDDSRRTLVPLHLLPISAACLPFAGGLLLTRLVASGWVRPGWAFPAALLAAALAASCLVVGTDTARWPGGIAAVLLVAAAVVGRPVRSRGPAIRVLLLLGDWSYVLYLVHAPAFMLAAWACPAHWSGVAYGAVSIAAALAATALLGPLDVSLYRSLRRAIDGAKTGALRRSMGAFLLIFFVCAAWGSLETVRNDRAESGSRQALRRLPDAAWASRPQAEAAIAQRGLALPGLLLGAVEAVERVSPNETLFSAFAFVPDRPDQSLQLALFCDSHLIGIDRPRRMRKDKAGQPGYENMGTHRIGYRIRIPADACTVGPALAVVVDEAGRMAVLADPRGAE